MITLAEGKATLVTLSALSKIGIFPFSIKVETGRLSKPSKWKVNIWYLSILFRAAYIAQQLFQMRSIYWLDENPERASAMHVAFLIAIPLIFILEVYLTAFKPDSVVLIFNELFVTAEKGRRRWKSMILDDLIVRYLVPALAILTPIMASCTITIVPQITLRLIDLPILERFKKDASLNFISFIMDVYHSSCAIIQLHVQVFFLLITCSKIVKDLLEAESSRRYQGIIKERQVFRRARRVQLYCRLANQLNSRITCTVKLLSLSNTIGFLYVVITQFNANIGFSLMFLYASFLTITCYGYICYYANPVADNMEELCRRLTSRTLAVGHRTYRLELLASVKSLKVEPVRVGDFHTLERESFLIFCDFVVNQLVSLLVA